MVGQSNVILDPTLALIRAQLGLRIQVQAECGKKGDNTESYGKSLFKRIHSCLVLIVLEDDFEKEN